MFGRLLFPAKVLFGLLILYLAWQGWVFLRPAPREYSEREQAAIRKLCREATHRVADELSGERVVGVAHFLGDPSDGFTSIMRSVISDHPGWRLTESSLIQEFLSDVTRAIREATSLEEILHAGHRVDIDAVVAGNVEVVRTVDEGAVAQAVVVIHDVRRGRTLLKEALSAEWQPSTAAQVRNRVLGLHPFLRFVFWIFLVLLLPVVTPFATHWALEKKNNLASFAVLAGYTIVDLFLALLFTGFRIHGSLRATMLCLAIAVCALYNFWVCERLAGRE